MKTLLARFVRDTEGQDLIEYAFLAVFIGLTVVTVLGTVGTNLSTQFSNIDSQLSSGS